MKITDVEVIPYRIPNRAAHHIATLTLSALDNTLVVIRTDAGVEGCGEAVSEAKWNSTVGEAHTEILRRHLAPALTGLDPLDVAAVWRAMDKAMNGQYSAKAAIDVALHDLIGRALGMPVWRYLGGAVRRTIEVEGPGFGIGFMQPDEAAAFAYEATSRGCGQIEIKGGHPDGWAHDRDVIEAVRARCGSEVSLKVDFTEGYNFKSALGAMPVLEELGVDWVEQPLPRHQLEDTARLRNATTVGIMLEESIGHPADVLQVARLGAADAIHVKLPMLGGFTMARHMAIICQAAGIGVASGSSTPSGLGLAATHHFAAVVPNLVRGCHGSPLARAVDDLIRAPIDAYATHIHLDESPGLGVTVDRDKLERYRIDR